MKESDMTLHRDVDPWLTSSYNFDHSYRNSKGIFVYSPDHARQVILTAKRGAIYASSKEIVPVGYSAIVSLSKSAGPGRSTWSVRLYQGIKTAEQVVYMYDKFDSILSSMD